MVGLDGIVIKSHGGADRVAFANAVRVAMTEARNGVPARIAAMLRTVRRGRLQRTTRRGLLIGFQRCVRFAAALRRCILSISCARRRSSR